MTVVCEAVRLLGLIAVCDHQQLNCPINAAGCKRLPTSKHLTQMAPSSSAYRLSLLPALELDNRQPYCAIRWQTSHNLYFCANSHCFQVCLPITQIKRLQHVQNGLARAVTHTLKHSHISPVLQSLHWLKVEQRIQYKIISITHNLLHITEPKYLHRLINIKPPSRTGSSDHLCLSLPPVSTRLKFGDRSFRNSSPRLWNSLPINLRSFAPDTHHSTTVSSSTTSHPCRALSLSRNQFLSRLKTHLFTLSYPP